VPFGQDKPVAIGPGRVGRIVTHHIEVERGQNLHGRKGSTRVAGFGFADHLHDLTADSLRDGLQLGHIFGLFHLKIQFSM
jgi:hypothetical protein